MTPKPPFTLAEQVTHSTYRVHYFDNAAQAQGWIAANRKTGMVKLTTAHGRRLHPDTNHRGDVIADPYTPVQPVTVLAIEPACRDL